MNDMNERVALVTGGTRGIGAAISTHLAQHGARIAAVYNRNAQAAEDFLKEASNSGLPVSLHQANVGNPGDCQRVVREVVRQYGRIDYLINNAGAAACLPERSPSQPAQCSHQDPSCRSARASQFSGSGGVSGLR